MKTYHNAKLSISMALIGKTPPRNKNSGLETDICFYYVEDSDETDQ